MNCHVCGRKVRFPTTIDGLPMHRMLCKYAWPVIRADRLARVILEDGDPVELFRLSKTRATGRAMAGFVYVGDLVFTDKGVFFATRDYQEGLPEFTDQSGPGGCHLLTLIGSIRAGRARQTMLRGGRLLLPQEPSDLPAIIRHTGNLNAFPKAILPGLPRGLRESTDKQRQEEEEKAGEGRSVVIAFLRGNIKSVKRVEDAVVIETEPEEETPRFDFCAEDKTYRELDTRLKAHARGAPRRG